MKVRWSPRAVRRVEEALDQISEDRPVTAERWLEGLFELVDTLSEMPERGRVVLELQRSEIRELQYRGYRLVYRVGHDQVGILTLKHSRQLMRLDDEPPGIVREGRTQQAVSRMGKQAAWREVARPTPEEVYQRVAARAPVELNRPVAEVLGEERKRRAAP